MMSTALRGYISTSSPWPGSHLALGLTMSRSWLLTLADSCVAFGLVLAFSCPRPCPSWRFSQTLDVHVHDSCSYLDQCGEPHADVSEDKRLHRPWLGHPRIISHHLHIIGKKTKQLLASSRTEAIANFRPNIYLASYCD